MHRKIIAACLSFMLVISMFSVRASAGSEFKFVDETNLQYETIFANEFSEEPQTQTFIQSADGEFVEAGPVETVTVGLEGSTVYDGNVEEMLRNSQQFEEDEIVTVIVELDEQPLGNLVHYLAPETVSADTAGATASGIIARALRVSAEVQADRIQIQHDSVLNAMSGFDLLREYRTLFNGFTVSLPYKEIEALKALPGVKDVYISCDYSAPEVNDKTANDMIGATIAWASGYSGKGTTIAIIDTGIDYNHELLKSLDVEGMMSKEQIVEKVTALNAAGLLNAGVDEKAEYYFNSKVIFGYDYQDDNRDPMDDLVKHGTHVAGIAAANVNQEGSLCGVAYDAQLFALKVFSSKNGAGSDYNILAAMEDAYMLGADVANMSLGSIIGEEAYPEWYPKFSFAGVIEFARQTGTEFVCSSGNEGHIGKLSYLSLNGEDALPLAENPDYGMAGAPSTDKNALSVASSDNSHIRQKYFKLGSTEIAYNDTFDAYPFDRLLNGKSLKVVYVPNYGHYTSYTSDPALVARTTGNIVLVQRGGELTPGTAMSFIDKCRYAMQFGKAVACIVYDNVDGPFINMALDTSYVRIPSIFITKASGELMLQTPEASRIIDISVDFQNAIANSTGGQISNFSSRGVTPTLSLKPDVTGVGGAIYSTLPGNSYGVMSGTSMSAPQVSGAMAAIRQYVDETYPGLSNAEKAQLAENILVSQADPILDENGVAYPPQSQGAGLIDLTNAFDTAGIIYNDNHKTKVELKDNVDPDNVKVHYYLENITDSVHSYALSLKAYVDEYKKVENEDTPGDFVALTTMHARQLGVSPVFTNVQTGQIISGAVEVAPGEKIEIEASFAISAEYQEEFASVFLNGYYIYGFLSALPEGAQDDAAIGAPFLGFVGEWDDLPIFDKGTLYDGYDYLADVPFYFQDQALINTSRPAGAVTPSGQATHFMGRDHIAMRSSVASDVLVPYLATLRTAWDVSAEVYDSEGNLVKDIYFGNNVFAKSCVPSSVGKLVMNIFNYGQWNGRDNDEKPVPDGQYNYVLKAHTSTGKVQTWELPVYIDNVTPTFTHEITERDGKTYLTVTATDNHFLKYVSVTGEKIAGKNIFLGGHHTYTTDEFDITELLSTYNGDLDTALKYVTVAVNDYAENFDAQSIVPDEDTSPTKPFIKAVSISIYMNDEAVIDQQFMIDGINLEGKEYNLIIGEGTGASFTPIASIPTMRVYPGDNTLHYFLPKYNNKTFSYRLTELDGTVLMTSTFAYRAWAHANAFSIGVYKTAERNEIGIHFFDAMKPATQYPIFAEINGQIYPVEAHTFSGDYRIHIPYQSGLTIKIMNMSYWYTFQSYVWTATVVTP